MNALESQSPEIAKLISGLTEKQCEAVGLAVSKYVVEKTGVNDPNVLTALTSPDKSNAAKLKEISEAIEQPYLQALDTSTIDEDHQRLFRQARAVYSLAEAISRPAIDHLPICIYEAIHANGAQVDEIRDIITEIVLS